MSGEKRRYVSVEQQELRRLRERESRLRSLQKDLPEQLNTIREQSQRELQQRMAPLENRVQRQQQQNQKLKSDLKDLENKTQQRLKKQQEEFKSQLGKVNQNLKKQQKEFNAQLGKVNQNLNQVKAEQRNQRTEYLKLIQEQNQQFEQLKQEQQTFQREVNERFKSIETEQERKSQLAKNYLTDLEAIYHQIKENYQHERFAPGKLDSLRQGVDLARNNYQNGVTEAAIAKAQESYLDLANLRLDLIQKEQEWELLYNAALSDVRSLLKETQGNRNCEVTVGEGEESEQFKLEVDYWVEGALTEYEKEIKALEEQLKQGEKTLTTEEVKQIGEQINQLEPKLGELIEQAKVNILSSQLRVEIADRVVEALSSAGFDLVNPEEDVTYEGNDQRRSYVVKVKNVSGDEVVTVISPEQEFGKNSVSINTFSETLIDEKATQQNAKAVFDLLEQEGIEAVGQLECQDQPKQEYQNLETVKARQASEAKAQKNSPAS
ncbi:MAG: hypothetical protein ACLFTJ_06205 [Halothece sp.]